MNVQLNLGELQSMEAELKDRREQRVLEQANTKDLDTQLELIRLAKLGLGSKFSS